MLVNIMLVDTMALVSITLQALPTTIVMVIDFLLSQNLQLLKLTVLLNGDTQIIMAAQGLAEIISSNVQLMTKT